MSAMADLLIDIVEKIQNIIKKEIDDETAANIQDWIMENFDSFKDDFTAKTADSIADRIAITFVTKHVCPKCKTIIYDHNCDCE
jgi:hypothetical protein